MTKLDKYVTHGVRTHSKASEKYIDVTFYYEDGESVATSIPLEYRRTGTDISTDKASEYLSKVSKELHPSLWEAWKSEQDKFWLTKKRAATTKEFFDVLSDTFSWCCVECNYPQNPNWARRVQDLKEFGYTIATNTGKYCESCGKKNTQQILVPIKRGGITGYETWSPAVRNKIIKVLRCYDAYEARTGKKENLLPDHKFPEIRWDESTKRESLELLSETDMIRDFQLMTNQRNQQKREVCRSCFQTNRRGSIYGISYYYEGCEDWDTQIPKTGKAAEQGCVGCPWYDIEQWRTELTKSLV